MKLYKFEADWCGPCHIMDKQLKMFDKCDVVHYDVEEYEDLSDEYKVKNIPTMILVDDNGSELFRWSGMTSVNEINKKIDELQNK